VQSTKYKHGEKKKTGNTIPQKTNNNNIIENLEESEGDESPVAVVRRMIRMFNKLKEDMQKQLNESQENTDKNSRRHKNS
jgi:hypothetical protein